MLDGGRVERIESKKQPRDGAESPPGDLLRPEAAVQQKLIPSNPAEGCSLPRLERREMQTLTVDQLEAFFREVKASGVFEFYYLELATGLWRGELLGLHWEDIDPEQQTITVRRQVVRVNGVVTEAPLKTKNSYRTLSIGADAAEILRQQKENVGGIYVFPSPTGGPISPDSVLHMLHRLLNRAGLPKVCFHDLRHTFATLALQNGVDIKTVSGMLGHYSADFTLDTYAHVTTTAQRQAADVMGNVLSGAF